MKETLIVLVSMALGAVAAYLLGDMVALLCLLLIYLLVFLLRATNNKGMKQ